MSEFALGVGANLGTSALAALYTAAVRRLSPEHSGVLHASLVAAVQEAAWDASVEQPATALLEVLTRPQVIDAIASSVLGQSPGAALADSLQAATPDVDWTTSGVDSDKFMSALRVGVPQAIISAGRTGGPLALFALHMRMDSLEDKLDMDAPPRAATAERRQPLRLPPPCCPCSSNCATMATPRSSV